MIKTIALRLAASALAPLLILTPKPAHAATATSPEIRMDHISVIKSGSGPAVVFIPGLGSPRASWDKVTAGLADHHTLYLIQVNGFGGDSPDGNLKPGILDGIVADLSAFLTREKAGRVRLVGHSMGGLAGLMMARAHPAQVERLMVVDALPYFPVLLSAGGPEWGRDQVEPVATAMRDAVAARYGKPADPAAIKRDVDGLAVKPESRAQMATWAAAADPRVTAQLLYEDMSTDVRPSLAGLKMPVTVVVPWTETPFGKDRTLAFYQRQYAGTPAIRYADIAGSGHFVMLDQPQLFRTALDAFLKP